MHFSIPCTRELKNESGTAYTAFDIHVNGVLHCTVRYSQLFDLNEKLKQELGTGGLPVFPPKKLFAVKGAELEDRKRQLEKYIQDLCQNERATNSELFASFLSMAQQETQLEEAVSVNFDIYLLNGSKIKINIQNVDKTNKILENVLAALGIKEDLTYYFGLFLIKSNYDESFSLIRQLQEFECPYLSLKSIDMSESYKIVLRKAYWDLKFDQDLLGDEIGLNLLQVQTESDVTIGWTSCDKEQLKRLRSLKSKGSKREYVQYCQTLPYYGYICLDRCLTNYPQEKKTVIISVGNFELVFREMARDSNVVVKRFQVTKMKSWKVSSLVRKHEAQTQETLLLTFEYLFSKGNLQWVEVLSDQAIMLSMSIKSMIDELLRLRGGGRIKRPSDRRAPGSKALFKARDKTTEALFDQSELDVSSADGLSNIQKAKDSVKKISEVLSKPPESQAEGRKPERTFEKIGDDDL